MFQKMLQGGGGEIKLASGTISGVYSSKLTSVDCGFKPTSIVVYANTFRIVTDLTSVYFENGTTIEKTYYNHEGIIYLGQFIKLTPTENGFTIKQTITDSTDGNGTLNYIAMKE